VLFIARAALARAARAASDAKASRDQIRELVDRIESDERAAAAIDRALGLEPGALPNVVVPRRNSEAVRTRSLRSKGLAE
jgi:hypothetical protein